MTCYHNLIYMSIFLHHSQEDDTFRFEHVVVTQRTFLRHLWSHHLGWYNIHFNHYQFESKWNSLQITSSTLTTLTIEIQTTSLQFLTMMLWIINFSHHKKFLFSLLSFMLTITSFKSFIWSWCKGSKKFCLTLSSSEYFTSAICFNESPNSTKAWAELISKFYHTNIWNWCMGTISYQKYSTLRPIFFRRLACNQPTRLQLEDTCCF